MIFSLFLACRVLEVLGLGKVVQSVAVPGGGCYNWFFVKHIPDENVRHILAALDVADDTTPTYMAYKASVDADTDLPTRAPSISWTSDSEYPYQTAVLEKLGLTRVPALNEEADEPSPVEDEAINGSGAFGLSGEDQDAHQLQEQEDAVAQEQEVDAAMSAVGFGA